MVLEVGTNPLGIAPHVAFAPDKGISLCVTKLFLFVWFA